MYTLRNDVIIRREFFGGLAIIINTGEYELDEFTTDFLLLFEKTNDEQQIVEIINNNYGINATIYDIKELYDQAKYFLTTTNSLYRVDDVSKLAKEMKYEREEIKKIDFLAAPLNLSIYPGMKCNLSCDFCFISQEKWDDDKIVYPLEKWKPVLDQVKKMKIPYLTILGGEPLMYPEIWDMLDYLDEIGQKTHITTNGMILNNRIIQELKKHPNLTLKVSIQSMDGRHAELTKGSLERALKFIKEVRSEGIECGIHTVGLKKTLDQIPEIAKFAHENGLNEFSMGVFFNINQVEIEEISLDEYREVGVKTKQYIKENYVDLNYRLEGCQLWTAEPTMRREHLPKTQFEILQSGCEAAQSRLEIMNDGTVLGCVLFNKHDFGAGNVFEEKLKDIWYHSKQFELIRKFKTSDTACSSCQFSYFCNGGCPALNIKKTGRIDTGDDRCGIRNKILEGNKDPVKIIN